MLVIGVIVVIVVVPIIYVAIPKKAQKDLNKSTLEVTSQEVTSPTADGIHLKLVSVAKSSSSFHPTIDGFQASLSLENKDPFIVIDIPETKAEAETNIVVEQSLKFASMDRFVEYNKVVMGTESFSVFLKGKTKIRQSGLQAISVDYNKKVTMKGLNKLSGLTITNLTILSGRENLQSDGTNMLGLALIPNPSVMTLSLGNVTMNLSVDNTPIGTTLLPDLILRPGNHSYPMRSRVDQLAVIQLITAKYKNAVLPIDILGNSSVIGDGVHLTYFEQAIQGNKIRVDLDVGPALKQIGFNLTSHS